MSEKGFRIDKKVARTVIEQKYDQLLSQLITKYLSELSGIDVGIPLDSEILQDSLDLAYTYLRKLKFGNKGFASNNAINLYEEALKRYDITKDLDILYVVLQTIAKSFLLNEDDMNVEETYANKLDEEFLAELDEDPFNLSITLSGLAVRRLATALNNCPREISLFPGELDTRGDEEDPSKMSSFPSLRTNLQAEPFSLDKTAKTMADLTARYFSMDKKPLSTEEAVSFALRIAEAYMEEIDDTGEWSVIYHLAKSSNDFNSLAEQIFKEACLMRDFAQHAELERKNSELINARAMKEIAQMINPSLAES